MFQRLLKWTANTLWYSTLGFVVLLAAYVALGRQFFPAISMYHQEIQSLLHEKAGVQLTIGEIEGRWDGLNPVIEFKSIRQAINPDPVAGSDASVGPAHQGASIGSFTIELAVVESILAGEPKIDDIRVDGVNVSAHQDESGQWLFQGLAQFSNGEAGNDTGEELALASIISSYLVHPYMEVSNIHVSFENRLGQIYELIVPKAQLVYDQDELSARGEVLTPNSDKPFAQFAFEGKGKMGTSDFNAVFYIDWQLDQFLEHYFQAYNWRGVELARVDANGQSWVTFRSGELSEVYSNLSAQQIQLRNDKQSFPPIEDLSASIRWENTPEASTLTIENLDFYWQGKTWSTSDYEWYESAARTRVRGTSANLDILTPLVLATGILEGEAKANLSGYHPLGRMNNIDVTVDHTAEEKNTQVRVAANLSNVAVSAYDGAPSGTGIDGLFQMTNAKGSVRFASNNFTMGFPELFLESWAFRYAEGDVRWDNSGDITEIFSEGIVLDYAAGGRVLGDFRLSLPDTPYDRYLSLNIAPKGIPASHTVKFLPYYEVDHGLYRWLEKAIVAGEVTEGVYIGHGAVGEGDPDGLFESAMYFDVVNGEVNFGDDWPNITGFTGRVAVDPNRMNISLNKGKLGKLDVSGATVDKNLLGQESHPITVKLEKKYTGDDARYAMSELPINTYTGEVASSIDIHGDIGLSLNLGIAVEDNQESSHLVEIDFPGIDVDIPGADLTFKQVDGKISYRSGRGIDGMLDVSVLGKTGKLVAKSYLAEEGQPTRVLLNSSVDLSEIESWLNVDPLYAISGSMDYTALLEVKKVDNVSVTSLDIRSDLVGVTSHWPDFFSKSKEESLSLHYRKILSNTPEVSGGLCEKTSFDVKDCFNLGDVLYGWRVPGEKDATTLSLMNQSAELSAKPGVWLKGTLQALDVSLWWSFFDEMQSGQQSQVEAASAISGVDMGVGRLNIYGHKFDNSRVIYEPMQEHSHLSFLGEALEGNIRIPKSEQPIEINLTRLKLTTQSTEEDAADDLPIMPGVIDISVIPDVNVFVTNLDIDGKKFDQFETRLRYEQDSLTLYPLLLRVDDDRVEGRLRWYQDPLDKTVSRTLFNGNVNVFDAGERWRAFGNSAAFDSKTGESEYTLTWLGSPMDFDLSTLSGRIRLLLKDGKIYPSNASANVLRVFGILNLETIGRRLRLDFSDLTENGISFDTIESIASIQNGVLTLESPLVIQGPSNMFKITGNTNLIDQALEFDMVVILPLTQNLPIAALFVGAPVIGGGLWVVDKLLGDPLSKITSATYEVRGTWDDPELKLKNVFDKALQNALEPLEKINPIDKAQPVLEATPETMENE